MAERFKAPVLKTGDVQASVGSNPTPSAKQSGNVETGGRDEMPSIVSTHEVVEARSAIEQGERPPFDQHGPLEVISQLGHADPQDSRFVGSSVPNIPGPGFGFAPERNPRFDSFCLIDAQLPTAFVALASSTFVVTAGEGVTSRLTRSFAISHQSPLGRPGKRIIGSVEKTIGRSRGRANTVSM